MKPTNQNSNTVSFSSLLKDRFPATFEDLTAKFWLLDIPWKEIDHTRDIWCRDYMPVHNSKGECILFKYYPDYLKGFPKLRTDSNPVCDKLGIRVTISNIILDGGNVVRHGRKAIMTDKIYSENPKMDRKTLVEDLIRLLDLDELILIPVQPGDDIGHADGMVRFLNENTVLVNDYSNADVYKSFQRSFYSELACAGLNLVQIPYFETDEVSSEGIPSARGCYINYLQVDNTVFLPQFGEPNPDGMAMLLFEKYFGKNVIPIDADEIAGEGGVLNCVSWDTYASG